MFNLENISTTNLTSQSLLDANPFLQDIIIAIIILLLGFIIGRILGQLVEKVLREFKVDTTVKKTIGVKTSMEHLAGNIVSYSIYFIFLIIALNKIGITSLLLNVLSILVIIVLGISIFLTVKDSIPNIVAYITLMRKKAIRPGDKIKISSVEGTIKDISLFATKIESTNGDLLYIPNNVFLKETYVRKGKRKVKRKVQKANTTTSKK